MGKLAEGGRENGGGLSTFSLPHVMEICIAERRAWVVVVVVVTVAAVLVVVAVSVVAAVIAAAVVVVPVVVASVEHNFKSTFQINLTVVLCATGQTVGHVE